jgi:hypothetical protein
MNVTSAIYVKPRDTLRFLTLRDAAANPFLPRGLRQT